MVLFEFFLSKKSDPNIHQMAPNCTIFKKFIGGACPRTPPPPPPAKRMASLHSPYSRMEYIVNYHLCWILYFSNDLSLLPGHLNIEGQFHKRIYVPRSKLYILFSPEPSASVTA